MRDSSVDMPSRTYYYDSPDRRAGPRARHALYRGPLAIVHGDDRTGSSDSHAAIYAVFDRPSDAFAGLLAGETLSPGTNATFAQLVPYPQPKRCDPETPLHEAWSRLRGEPLGMLPVLDAQGVFLGVLTRDSVVEALLEDAVARRTPRASPARVRAVFKASRSLIQAIGHVQDEELLARRGLRLLMTLLDVRYGAIGIMDEHGGLQQFIYEGLDAAQAQRIGRLPEGKGLLGVVLREGTALRLDNIAADPRAAGFPPGHPVMRTLLAVPVAHRDQIIGRLYLCDRRDWQPFSEQDETLARAFAGELALLVANERHRREAHDAQAETARLLAENRLLARRLIASQEEERRHLARELHDELAQYVTAMRAEAQRLILLARGDDAAVHESALALASLCERTQDLAREVLRGLAPTLVYEAGLADALRELSQSFTRHHGSIRLRLALVGDLDGVPTPAALTAYRVVQEAITNAALHARASRVLAGVRRHARGRPQCLHVVVRDNGCGFDPAAVTAAVGIAGMRERVEALNGELHISSRAGAGTRVEAFIPAIAASETS
jgi:signal transduction histidine kinase